MQITVPGAGHTKDEKTQYAEVIRKSDANTELNGW